MKEDLSKIREEKCIPIAMSILRVIAAEENLLMGSPTQEAVDAYYKKLFAEKVEPIIRTADLKLSDIKFIFTLVTQVTSNVQAVTNDAMNEAFDSCVAFKFGIADVSDVKVSDVIRIQGEAAEKLSTGTSVASEAAPA